MSTLQIRKLQSGAFKHVDSIDGEFFLGRFNFKQEFNKAFLVEAYGATRRKYSIAEISVYNYLGTAETFTNWTDLLNRLTDLGYTGIETNGIIPTGAYLSDDPTQYLDATLPLTGTEVAILNNGTNWVSITWNNIKTQLKAYFDTLYQSTLVSGTNIKTINGTSILGSGDLVVSGGGGANKRTVCFTYEFNGVLNTATNNWWGAISNGVPSQLTSNASLTPVNNFSSAPVQSPAWVVPFNCRLKSITFKGFSNTVLGVVDLAFTSGTNLGSGAVLVNNTILSNQPLTLHNYLGVSGPASLYVFDTGFTNYVIPKGYEIRMFMNNRNVAKNLLSTTIIVEFEEEI